MRVGVILAGGQSRRMGMDKAGLRLHGQTLLQRAHGLLAAIGCTKVVISGPVRVDRASSLATIPDQFPHAGPVGGICTTMSFLRAELEYAAQPVQVIFLPVDLPVLQPETLQRLCMVQETIDAVFFAGSPLPLLLRTTGTLWHTLENIQKQLHAGCSVKKLLQPLTAHALPCTDVECHQLRNANTPQEWQEICDECTP